jgi:hypothetical protein
MPLAVFLTGVDEIVPGGVSPCPWRRLVQHPIFGDSLLWGEGQIRPPMGHLRLGQAPPASPVTSHGEVSADKWNLVLDVRRWFHLLPPFRNIRRLGTVSTS